MEYDLDCLFNPIELDGLVNDWITAKYVYHRTTDFRVIFIDDLYFIDPFSKEVKLINRYNQNKYFLNTYNLDASEVFNLVKGDSISYTPSCPICGSDLKFVSLRAGFNQFCSLSCRSLYWSPLTFTEERRESFRNMVIEYNRAKWLDPEYRKSESIKLAARLNTPECRANNQLSILLNSGSKDDQLILYLAYSKINKLYKFGVTSYDLVKYAYSKRYDYFHQIYSGSRLKVAFFEYYLKINLLTGEWINEDEIKRFKVLYKEIKYKIENNLVTYEQP